MFAVYDKNFTDMVDKLIEEQKKEEISPKKQKKEEMQPIDEWIKFQKFKTTEDIKVPVGPSP